MATTAFTQRVDRRKRSCCDFVSEKMFSPFSSGSAPWFRSAFPGLQSRASLLLLSILDVKVIWFHYNLRWLLVTYGTAVKEFVFTQTTYSALFDAKNMWYGVSCTGFYLWKTLFCSDDHIYVSLKKMPSTILKNSPMTSKLCSRNLKSSKIDSPVPFFFLKVYWLFRVLYFINLVFVLVHMKKIWLSNNGRWSMSV